MIKGDSIEGILYKGPAGVVDFNCAKNKGLSNNINSNPILRVILCSP